MCRFKLLQTFRQNKKNIPEGTIRYDLHKRANASLHSGLDLKHVVKLPPGEEMNDWIAVHGQCCCWELLSVCCDAIQHKCHILPWMTAQHKCHLLPRPSTQCKCHILPRLTSSTKTDNTTQVPPRLTAQHKSQNCFRGVLYCCQAQHNTLLNWPIVGDVVLWVWQHSTKAKIAYSGCCVFLGECYETALWKVDPMQICGCGNTLGQVPSFSKGLAAW